jgi:hypothetical protein
VYPPSWPLAHSSNHFITGRTTPFLRSSDTAAPDVEFEWRGIPSSGNNALIGVDIVSYLTADMSLRALNLRSGPDDQMHLPSQYVTMLASLRDAARQPNPAPRWQARPAAQPLQLGTNVGERWMPYLQVGELWAIVVLYVLLMVLW